MNNERIRLCDVIDKCEECPRYADDCDGDKRIEPTDLISRADAIEALRGLFDMRKSRAKVIVECFGKLLDALPSADAEWIQYSAKTPKEKQEVYVTVYFTEGDTGRAYGYIDGFGKWHLYSAVEGVLNSGYKVTAWMPLPKPYKGGDDE